MIEFIKSKINEKKILKNTLRISNLNNEKLLEANQKQQEDIYKLKEAIRVWEEIDRDYIIKLNELECNFNEKSKHVEELEKKLKEANENNKDQEDLIKNLRGKMSFEQCQKEDAEEKLVRTEKKLTRERNKNSKLNIELLQSQKVNKELVNKVNISAIARQQLKELCKYNENNNKEPDKVKRPGVLVNKKVSGVKVYELANLM